MSQEEFVDVLNLFDEEIVSDEEVLILDVVNEKEDIDVEGTDEEDGNDDLSTTLCEEVQDERLCHKMTWLRTKFKPSLTLQEPSYSSAIIEDPSNLNEYLQEYIDDQLIQLMVDVSNQNALEKTNKNLNFTCDECKIFIGITLLMSCINYPSVRMYWNQKYAVPIITESMNRNRYQELRNFLKLVPDQDATLETQDIDKIWKVRPLLDRILQGCHAQKRFKKVAITEIMIPFTGENELKQNSLGLTGLKAFVLVNPNGLICDILFYQGKDTVTSSSLKFSFKESIVLKLTETLRQGHIIYCDNRFATVKLLDELNCRGFKCTGTVKNSQIPKDLKCILMSDEALLQKGLGSYDVLVREDGNLALTKWCDHKPITFMSSIHGAENLDPHNIYNKRLKKFVTIQRPEVVREFNSVMEDAGLTNKLLSISRTRTSKWTVRFITYMIDLAAVNSWIKYKEDNEALGVTDKNILNLKEFKQQLAERMIFDNTYREIVELDGISLVENIRRRGRAAVPLPSTAKRLHGANHLPVMSPKAQRCRNKGCQMKSRTSCGFCNIALCLTSNRNCFVDFHT